MKDQTWLLYNKRIESAIAERDWYLLGTIYYEMAYRVEQEGTNGEYLKQKGYEAKLRHHMQYLDNYRIDGVEISSNDPKCALCYAQNGRVIPAEDARLLKPLPVKDCPNEWGCRCTYLPVLD